MFSHANSKPSIGLSRAVDLAIVAALGVCAAYAVQLAALSLEGARAAFKGGGLGLLAFVGAIAVYMAAHLLRAIRLYIIVGIGRIGFTALLGYHSVIALTTFGVPFKAGEVLRAAEAYRLLGNSVRGIFAIWIDRVFDVATIALTLGLLASAGQHQTSVLVVLAASTAFLVASIMVILVVPGALKSFARAMLASTSRRSMLLLKGCTLARKLLLELPRLDPQTVALLSIITGVIWTFEMGALALVLNAMSERPGPLLAQAADVLAGTLMIAPAEPRPHVAVYQLVSLIGLAALSALTAGRYVRARLAVRLASPGRELYRHAVLFTTPRLQVRGRCR